MQSRKQRNTIRELKGPNGEVLKKSDEIKSEAERFFKDFLNLQPHDFEGMTVEELRNLLPFPCQETDQDMLTKMVTEEEIQKVLFAMPNDKSQTDILVSFSKLPGLL